MPPSIDRKERDLQEELASCVMSSSWWCCVAGVLIAIPWGVKTKSFMPVVYCGVAGTLMDLLNGYDRCKEQRHALESYLRAREAFGAQPTSAAAWPGQERPPGGGDDT